MPSDRNTATGYIVSYPINPDDDPAVRGYVFVNPDVGQFYHGPLDNPDQWKPLGQSPTPGGKKFPRNQIFTFDLTSRDNTMKLAWVVTYAPRPAAEYAKRNLSPFKETMLRNSDRRLAVAGEKPDSKGEYHYRLTTETMENGGRFLFSIYATIVEGNGAGKAFTVDPEMEVSEI